MIEKKMRTCRKFSRFKDNPVKPSSENSRFDKIKNNPFLRDQVLSKRVLKLLKNLGDEMGRIQANLSDNISYIEASTVILTGNEPRNKENLLSGAWTILNETYSNTSHKELEAYFDYALANLTERFSSY